MDGKLNDYNKIIDYIISKHDIYIDRLRAKMFALYFGSILTNMQNKKINYNNLRENDKTINFYGLMFLSSGSGKDFGKNIAIRDIGDDIVNRMNNFINNIIQEQIKKDGKRSTIPEKYRNKKITNYKVPLTNTDAGLYMNALLISKSMFGSLNIEVNEFGDIIGKQNQINLLNELYDGELDIGQIQGNEEEESREAIYGLKTNLFAYGSFSKIKTDKKIMDKLISTMQSGLFRRSIVYFEEPTPDILEEKKEILIGVIKKKYKDKIKNCIIANNNKVVGIKNEQYIDLTNQAKEYIQNIRKELIDRYNQNLENELIAVDKSAHITILKIASIISVLNNDDLIDVYHIKEAYSIFKETRKTTEKLFELKSEYEILYSKILNKSLPRHYLKSLLNKTDKNFDDLLKDTKGYAIEKNSQVYTKVENGITFYVARKLERTNEIIDFSYIVSPGSQPIYTKPLNYEFIGSIEDFNYWIKQQNGLITLSQCLLSNDIYNGYKTNKSPNNIKYITMIVFDFDETLSAIEITNMFQGVKYLIRQSKNWNKNTPKFHVYLPLKYKIETISKDEYKDFYENVCLKFGITDYVDMGLKNITHTVDESPDKDGKIFDGKILDPRCCLPYSDDFNETERIYSMVKTRNRVTGYIATFIDTMVYRGSNRTAKINKWLYRFENETENKPTKEEMIEGLEWIYNVAKDKIGKGEPDRQRFIKRINKNFE